MEKADPPPVKLFLAVLCAGGFDSAETIERLGDPFGTVDFRSRPFPFDHTDYYDAEMGAGLTRLFFGFSPLVDPCRLADARIETGRLEDLYRMEGKRRVNLDPGFIDHNKVVLASMKPGGWKIYLGSGVYADMTLYYAKGGFIRFGWTFPDYRSGIYDATLLRLRTLFKKASAS